MEFHLSDLQAFFDTFTAIPEDDNVDCTIMQMPPNPVHFIASIQNVSKKMADSLKEQSIQVFLNMRRTGKPFAMWRSAMDIQEKKLTEFIESHSLPVFPSSERAIRALSALYRYKKYKLHSLAK